MSGVESLVTQVHKGEAVPRAGSQPNNHITVEANDSQSGDESCWQRLFCCQNKKTTPPGQQASPPENNQPESQTMSEEPPSQQPAVHQPTVIEPLTEPPLLLTSHQIHDMEAFHQPGYHYLLPPLRPGMRHKKTLVLDLDETLVHSSFTPIDDYDFKITIELNRQFHDVYVRKRPFVDHFMNHISRDWEVVIFTASLSKYADPLLDVLDPHGTITSRLFRESCVHHFGTYYVKDLNTVGRPLADCTIIDNSPFSYMFQPQHGVPIKSWYDDPTDTQLLDMLPFLDMLAHCVDIGEAMYKCKNLFVDGGIVSKYVLPQINMIDPSDRFDTPENLALLQSAGASAAHLTIAVPGTPIKGGGAQQGAETGLAVTIPPTPHINRSDGRSALNSPVAGNRAIPRYENHEEETY